MKHIIASLTTVLLLSMATPAVSQTVRCGNLLPVNATLVAPEFTDAEAIWKYVWDLDLNSIGDEFILLEIQNLEDFTPSEFYAIRKEEQGGFPVLKLYHRADDAGRILYYFPFNNTRAELLPLDNSFETFVECMPGRKYERSYINNSYTEYKLVRDNIGPCFYYVDFNEKGALTAFSGVGLSSDEIIGSDRSIVPANHWTVSYFPSGNPKEIVNAKSGDKVSFEYKSDGSIQYKRVSTGLNGQEYGLYSLAPFEPDAKNRWTQEALCRYDVVLDALDPWLSVKRTFIADSQFETYKRNGFGSGPAAASTTASSSSHKEKESASAKVKEEPVEDEKVYSLLDVDELPTFQGQDPKTFNTWLYKHLSYPSSAKQRGISGRVVVQFTVSSNGSLRDIIVVKSVDKVLDEEAVRAVSESPRWDPAKKNGKKVSVTYTYPVIFKL